MAIVVVCGSGRGVGKTSLVCGLIAAIPEMRWTACKITSHDHGKPEPVWEETESQGATDTARFRAAGAERALLISASNDELEAALSGVLVGPREKANAIFESNRILQHVKPDLCLAVASSFGQPAKPSFARAIERMDALVMRGDEDDVREGATPRFVLANLERPSAPIIAWVRARLRTQG